MGVYFKTWNKKVQIICAVKQSSLLACDCKRKTSANVPGKSAKGTNCSVLSLQSCFFCYRSEVIFKTRNGLQ